MPGRTRSPNAGFTLLEVILAILLIVVAFTGLAQALSLGLFRGSANESLLVATLLTQEKMEEIRNKSYANISAEAKADVSGFTGFQREVAVQTPITDLKQVTVTVYWFDKDDELDTSLVTYASNV